MAKKPTEAQQRFALCEPVDLERNISLLKRENSIEYQLGNEQWGRIVSHDEIQTIVRYMAAKTAIILHMHNLARREIKTAEQIAEVRKELDDAVEDFRREVMKDYCKKDKSNGKE